MVEIRVEMAEIRVEIAEICVKMTEIAGALRKTYAKVGIHSCITLICRDLTRVACLRIVPTFWTYASQSNIGLIKPNVPSQGNARDCWQIAPTLECLGILRKPCGSNQLRWSQ